MHTVCVCVCVRACSLGDHLYVSLIAERVFAKVDLFLALCKPVTVCQPLPGLGPTYMYIHSTQSMYARTVSVGGGRRLVALCILCLFLSFKLSSK